MKTSRVSVRVKSPRGVSTTVIREDFEQDAQRALSSEVIEELRQRHVGDVIAVYVEVILKH